MGINLSVSFCGSLGSWRSLWVGGLSGSVVFGLFGFHGTQSGCCLFAGLLRMIRSGERGLGSCS